MEKLTEKIIQEIFGDKTFSRGLDYYNRGHVFGPVRIENILFAHVHGNAPAPYEVRASINNSEISTQCTCPVGYMCKHGVALLLKWAKEPASFIDADGFLLSLETMSKDEIINMIKGVIKGNPSRINEFYLEKENKSGINIDAISDRIGWIVHGGELDYYHIWDTIHSLEEIKSIADRLKEKESYKNAAEIYLALIKGGVSAYNDGIDDSDGGMGSFVSECITDFNDCMKQIDDRSYKNKFLEDILDIIDEEDYGLETQEMLCGIVTEENIHHIEEYMMEKLAKERKTASGFSYTSKKESTIELLIELYEQLGKPDEMLRLAQYELTDKGDYARLAKVLEGENRLEDALDAVKKGLALPGESFFWLDELYFELAGMLVHKRPDLIDFKISLIVALDMMSREFDKEEYRAIKAVFYSIGKLDEFKSAMLKNLTDRDNAIQALLYDGELKYAIEMIRREPDISPDIIIAVSKAAKDKGLLQESALLTCMVLERGWTSSNPSMDELLRVMVDISNLDALQEISNSILEKGTSGTAILLIPYLMKKAPELAGILVKGFINHMPVDVVGEVARTVAEAERTPENGVNLCRLRINENLLSSHAHYDKVVYLLKVMRDIYAAKGNESRWFELIRRFAAENKGKKKLIEKLKKEFKVTIPI